MNIIGGIHRDIMNQPEITLGNKIISHNTPPYFIADIAANHDGDLDRAFKLIELAKEAGADCAKFQNFSAPTIVSKGGFESIGKKLSHQSSWNKSVYDIYHDASIPIEWTPLLKDKCDDVGIEYLTTPYDHHSVDATDPFLNGYKIGSGDISWIDFLEYVATKNKPVLLATGASTIDDVVRAVNCILAINPSLILMQCNTNYTASPENYKYVNLNVLKQYRTLYPQCILGLSDHTFGHATVLGAITLGARVIEKHFTDDNSRTGPDHKFSMNPDSWRDMVDRSIELYMSLGDGNKKIEDNEKESFIVQRRGLYYKQNLEEGHILSSNDVIPLRPFKEEGIHPYQLNDIIGKTLNQRVYEDQYITWSELDD